MNNLSSKAFIVVIRKLLAIIFTNHNAKKTLNLAIPDLKSHSHSGGRRLVLLWPDGMSYLQWQKILRSVCWFLYRKKKKVSSSDRRIQRERRRVKKFLKALRERKEQKRAFRKLASLKQNKLNILASECNCKKEPKDAELELITLLKKFLERKNISEMAAKKILDRRDPETITYSVSTIILAALSIFLLRMESGNKYDDKFSRTEEKYSKINISKFIDAPEGHHPTIKTIEDFLKKLLLEEINDLMIQFFQDLMKSKFFSDHSEIQLGDCFLVAVDCVHSHTYCKPHHLDGENEPDCPYCLRRVYNKGTSLEKNRWIHNTLVYTFVFLNHLKIPFYTYPIRAQQAEPFETASDAEHKQEVESIGMKKTLPLIRKFFPKMKICLLLDGLYANRPTLQLAEQYGCKYAIVRKEACLSSLGKDCDGLAQLPNHQKDHTKITVHVEGKWKITRNYEWFNNIDLGVDKDKSIITHVLRFSETREKTNKRTEKKEIEHYKGEWLFSEKLFSRTCELAARKARLRWEEEDLFNSQKNREFNYKHDYSRHPRSFIIWQALSFFAFGIFELFRFSEPVMQRICISTESKKTISRIALVEKLSAQLCERPTEEIFSKACMSKRIQFRYDFSPPKPKNKLIKKNGTDRLKVA